MIENNRTSSELFHENAYTNNTFSLKETERTIRRTLENSFNYLKNLQRSYVSMARFNVTEEDVYFDQYNRPCISIGKDFIDVQVRKTYKLSKYYNTYVDIHTLMENPDIFLYVPIVLIDGKSVFSYKVKSALDGHTDITFTHIELLQQWLKEYHSISVLFMKYTYLCQFDTNKYLLQKYNWTLPPRLTNIDVTKAHGVIFYMMRDKTESAGSNFFIANVDEEGNIHFDEHDDVVYDFLYNHREVEVTIVSPDDLIEIKDPKIIHSRIDNHRQSCAFVIEENPWEHYRMPIPPQNIIVFKRNKVTGELTYENNKDVILHYPNIYEIMSDDVDADEYDYKLFYFFKKTEEIFNYRNNFKYIFRYFARKLECSYEEAVNKLLYTEVSDKKMQDYFLSIFDYEDASYLYGHGDFFQEYSPFDFDYKTNKMREFLDKNPYAFIPYAKRVATPFQSYHLFVKNIDLAKRERMDTTGEVLKDSDKFYFQEPFYVFMFGNETNSNLDLRFFIDGIFCDSCLQLHVGDMEYIYIPKSYIKEDSYITIERFESYTYHKKITFKDTETPVTLDFRKKEFIQPTLFDLFITDDRWNHLDRTKFKMYTLIDKSEYDVSDILEGDDPDTIRILMADELYVDPETGEMYLILSEEDALGPYEGDDPNVDHTLELSDHDKTMHDYENHRLPVKYLKLRKLKIFCKDPDYLNTELRFIVNKVPYISQTCMEEKTVPNITLFNGNIPWKRDKSFIRTFVNGRYQPMEYDIVATDSSKTMIMPRCYLYKGDVLSIDLTPYSYELECSIDEIPENFLVALNGRLTKPFDHAYYDVYLNGRKLDSHNVRLITPDKIQFFNVKSRKNLKIFRRDRDYEYYGLETTPHVHLDDILESEDVKDEDKENIIFDIIHDYIEQEHELDPDEDVKPGEDSEWNNENIEYIPPEIFHKYRFYVDWVLPQGIARPNKFLLSHNMMRDSYTGVYEAYSNKDNRVVLRPNVNWNNAAVILWLGKNLVKEAPPYITDDVNAMLEAIGDGEELKEIWDGTVLGSLVELIRRLSGIQFRVHPETGFVHVIFDYDPSNDFTEVMDRIGNVENLRYLADGSIIGAVNEIIKRMNGITFEIDPETNCLRACFQVDHDADIDLLEEALGDIEELKQLGDGTVIGAVTELINRLAVVFNFDPVSGQFTAEAPPKTELIKVNNIFGKPLIVRNGDNTIADAMKRYAVVTPGK